MSQINVTRQFGNGKCGFNLYYSWIWKLFDILNWLLRQGRYKIHCYHKFKNLKFLFSLKHISILILCFHPYVIERISLLKIDTISGYLIEFKKIYGDECYFNIHDWIYHSNLLTKINAFVQRCTFPFVNEIR